MCAAAPVPAARAKVRRQHKFAASHLGPDAFKADGLRTYAHYRDLGIKDATGGMALAHVIRFTGKCDPKVVSKRHTHECDFQMIYVLKGTIKTEIEGHGVHTMNAGDCWLQPQRHRAQGARLFRRLRGAGDRAAGGLQDGRTGKVIACWQGKTPKLQRRRR